MYRILVRFIDKSDFEKAFDSYSSADEYYRYLCHFALDDLLSCWSISLKKYSKVIKSMSNYKIVKS